MFSIRPMPLRFSGHPSTPNSPQQKPEHQSSPQQDCLQSFSSSTTQSASVSETQNTEKKTQTAVQHSNPLRPFFTNKRYSNPNQSGLYPKRLPYGMNDHWLNTPKP